MEEIRIDKIKKNKYGVVVEYITVNGEEFHEKRIYPDPNSFLGQPTEEFEQLIDDFIDALIESLHLERDFWELNGKVAGLNIKHRDDCLMVKVSGLAKDEEEKNNLTLTSPYVKFGKYDLNDLFKAARAYIDGEREVRQLVELAVA